MIANNSHIAVLTGDLVDSTTLGEARVARAFEALASCARSQEAWHGAPLHFTRHRGDGWQVALAKPALALRSALAFRATLRAEGEEFDSYIAIALGEAPKDIAPNLNSRSEQVFIKSGRALDDLKATNLPVRIIHESLGAVDAATILADHLSQGWTSAQSETILHTLDPQFDGTYTSIAKQLGKSRQAVTKSLIAAGYDFLDLALSKLEKDSRND